MTTQPSILYRYQCRQCLLISGTSFRGTQAAAIAHAPTCCNSQPMLAVISYYPKATLQQKAPNLP